MKPYKIWFFLIIVFLLTLLLAFLFPRKGVYISDNLSLKFNHNLFQTKDTVVSYADISDIVEENEKDALEDNLDSVIEQEKKNDTLRANAVLLKKKIRKIEYLGNDTSILFPFFKKLNKSQSRRVRIMHYGDSQIEGDRITDFLRNRFQKQFGGSGMGFVPILPQLAESSSIIHKASSNWKKHAVYYRKDTVLPHKKFGVLGSFARYTTYEHDSLANDTTTELAWVEFERSGMAYKTVRNFTQVNVYYGHNNHAFNVKGYVNSNLVWFETPEPVQNTNRFSWNLETSPQSFRIEFEGSKSADFYGISLDSPKGVVVDNLPFRGSSGTEFSKLDLVQLKQMTKNLNVGLIILQFGVNVVPYKVKSFKFYENAMVSQIRRLKAAMPNTPVLVVGVSDMSQRKGEYYESYPTVYQVVEAQKNAAKRTNSAFWNLFEAMGGNNSMPSWVFASPPLANKDFTHFNRRGGHIISQMLFNAIMFEYNNYQGKK